MLMKCKTCEHEFAPARNNILHCNKCIILKKVKNNKVEEHIKGESETYDVSDNESGENVKKKKNIP